MASKLAGLKLLSVVTCVGMLAACSNKDEEVAAPPPPPVQQQPEAVDNGGIDQEALAGPEAGSIEDLIDEVGTDRVFFAFDSSELSNQARETLRRGAQWLNANPAVQLRIEGHCDERGTREYNLALGERRANAVRNYLIALGVSGSRLDTISYGKERPAVLGSGEEAWAKNRRAVATVVSNGAFN